MPFSFSASTKVRNVSSLPEKGPYVLIAGTGWCGYSIRAKSVISAYAKALNALKPVAGGKLPEVYALDCEKYPQAVKVSSYPTVFYVDPNGKRKVIPRNLKSLFSYGLKNADES